MLQWSIFGVIPRNTSWAKEKPLANVPQTYWSELLKLIERITFWVMSLLTRHTDVAWLSYDFLNLFPRKCKREHSKLTPLKGLRRMDLWWIPSRLACPEAKFVIQIAIFESISLKQTGIEHDLSFLYKGVGTYFWGKHSQRDVANAKLAAKTDWRVQSSAQLIDLSHGFSGVS